MCLQSLAKMLTVSEFHSLGIAFLKALAPRRFLFLHPYRDATGKIESWSEENGLEHTWGWSVAGIQGLFPAHRNKQGRRACGQRTAPLEASEVPGVQGWCDQRVLSLLTRTDLLLKPSGPWNTRSHTNIHSPCSQGRRMEKKTNAGLINTRAKYYTETKVYEYTQQVIHTNNK